MDRQGILKKRRSLSSQERQSFSLSIVEKFLAHFDFKNQKNQLTLALYRSTEDEVQLSQLEKKLASHKKIRLCFPRIKNASEGILDLVTVSEKDLNRFVPGPFQILEPPADLKPLSDDQVQLIIVPGVVFGPNGERVGMGKGFYDRLLPRFPSALKVAFCFDFQLYPKVPQQTWDHKMDWIITPSKEIILPRAKSWIESFKNE